MMRSGVTVSGHLAVRTSTVLGVLLLLLVGGGCGDDDTDASSLSAYGPDGRALRALETPARLPNLVVVVIDALRADALPLDLASPKDEQDLPMPYFDRLASNGVSFSNVAAAAPWTLPSMTSLLTGLQPSEHGLYLPDQHLHLIRRVATFAEVLHEAYGYETAAFVSGPWFSGSGRSILQGFEHQELGFSLRATQAKVERWARTRDPSEPFFLLLHTFDAHDPYGAENHPWPEVAAAIPPDPKLLEPDADPAEIFRRCATSAGMAFGFAEALGDALPNILHHYAHAGYAAAPRPDIADELRTAYWAGVSWVDGLLETTHGTLRDAGLLDGSLLVVTSDHGETFGEHGHLIHGCQLYDVLLRVPLVMVGPPPFDGARIVDGSVALVDVLPTFFEWAGLEAVQDIEGRSALGMVQGDITCRPVLSEERLTHANTGQHVDVVLLSARTSRWKYVVRLDLLTGDVREEAYDLAFDPEETEDLAAGTGVLPAEFTFDACFCGAVEMLRARIWDRFRAEPAASHIAYGVTSPAIRKQRPSPCRASAH